jgi:hypothetical protein
VFFLFPNLKARQNKFEQHWNQFNRKLFENKVKTLNNINFKKVSQADECRTSKRSITFDEELSCSDERSNGSSSDLILFKSVLEEAKEDFGHVITCVSSYRILGISY